MKSDSLRKKFLEYFKSHNHRVVESDSLVPAGDPTVLFTPAGMNQFKKQFMGIIGDFTRAASSQRCLRTDDLDKVGKTSGHHTFFEMLGNFSFGDYFKEKAILYAWGFLTKELGVSQDKLWVSVYKDDEEAYAIWRDKIKLPGERIVRLGDKENFWPSEAKQKGPNGPCGPCSEIFFDQGRNAGCGRDGCTPPCNCGRFLEVWNLVFTQFNRKEGGKLEPLPRKNIDTGMGLERLAAVMQGVGSNFETDLFKPLIGEILREAPGRANDKEAIYAVADHIRAVTFAIYDGVLPSNEGRGYVIRKLIRKGALHLAALGIKKPFLYKLVAVLADIMKEAYPDLSERRENIAEIILAEEKNFISILNSSDRIFGEKLSSVLSSDNAEKIGAACFKLYDTYGIPLEVTAEWLEKKGFKDLAKVNKSAGRKLEEQKSRSKTQSAMKGDVFDVKGLHLDVKKTRFLGYDKYETAAKVLCILKDNKQVKKITKGEEASIVLDKTVFYAESGGQVGDSGSIKSARSAFEVSGTSKSEGVFIHCGKMREGTLRAGGEVKAIVDKERRLSIARNHTATHLLQAALRKILGAHVKQQGSLVGAERLRFDFTHFKDIDNEQLRRIESEVNGYILDDIQLNAKETTLSQAKKKGALAFFAEKYGKTVRVVEVEGVSSELCGGTHLNHTGQIGLFKIIQEGSVASGIRRIEAVTGKVAYALVKEDERIIEEVQSILNTEKEKIPQQLEAKLSRLKVMEKERQSMKIEGVRASLDKLLACAEDLGGIKVIAEVIPDADMNVLRNTMDAIKNKISGCVAALGAAVNGRAILVIGVTRDLAEKGWDAGGLITAVASVIGGSGGGRKDFAQAGGNNPENFAQAFKEFRDIIQARAAIK